MIIYYYLETMHFLKYYIPLIQAFNKKKYKNLIYFSNGRIKTKTDNQAPILHGKYLNELSIKYNFQLKHINEFENKKAILFAVEGGSFDTIINQQNKKYKIISLTYCWDYYFLYDNYINNIDFCIFALKKEYINKLFFDNEKTRMKFEKFNHNMKKNLFLGPTYLNNKNEFNKDNIIKNYNIPVNKKYIFIFLPVLKYPLGGILDLKILDKVLSFFVDKGFHLLIKTKDKWSYPTNYVQKLNKNIQYFTDVTHYPHVSSELIYISDFVLSFNSSGFIEALHFKKPVINFDLKYQNGVFNKINKFLINKYTQYIEGDYNNLENNYTNVKKIIEQNQFDDYDFIGKTPINDIVKLVETL
jgi:hypothetical protein